MTNPSPRLFTPRLAALAALFALLLSLSAPQLSAAHAEPKRSNPAAGSTVATVPTTLEIWFSEEVGEGTTISVDGPKGAAADNGDTTIDLNDPERKHVTVTVKPDQGKGTYTVRWSSVSNVDKDSAYGEFTFTVNAAAASTSGSPVATPAQTVVPTPAPTAEPKYDARGYAVAVGVGLVFALILFGFWRLVRPKNPTLG